VEYGVKRPEIINHKLNIGYLTRFVSQYLHRQVNTLKVVMPDLTRALQGIRHPVFLMDSGIRRNDGNSGLLLPE
jgi:hypothetical protein